MAEDKTLNTRGDKRAEKIYELWTASNIGARREWQSIEQDSYNFFLNNQLSSSNFARAQ